MSRNRKQKKKVPQKQNSEKQAMNRFKDLLYQVLVICLGLEMLSVILNQCRISIWMDYIERGREEINETELDISMHESMVSKLPLMS